MGPLNETAYLTAQNTVLYRTIMRILYDENVSEIILKNKRAAYQELLISFMKEDLKKFSKNPV